MDNNNRPEYNDRERHNSIKKKLKIVGFICLIAGAVFTAIGLIDFFAGRKRYADQILVRIRRSSPFGNRLCHYFLRFQAGDQPLCQKRIGARYQRGGKRAHSRRARYRFRRQGGIERQHEG